MPLPLASQGRPEERRQSLAFSAWFSLGFGSEFEMIADGNTASLTVIIYSRRGNGASVLRIVPYAALHFAAYERYRRALLVAIDIDPDDRTQQVTPRHVNCHHDLL